MDATHVAFAAGGVFVSWWFLGAREAPKPEVPSCRCVCAIQPEVAPQSSNSLVILVVGLFVLLLCANLILVFRVSVKQVEGGEKEYTFSFKGKSGKGVYNPVRGLSISDR